MIRSDRYKPTRFQEEKNTLFIKENKAYTDNKDHGTTLMATKWQPNGNQPAPQVRLGKVSTKDFSNEKSLPLEVVRDEEKKPRPVFDKTALNLREWCYGRIHEEYGSKPTTNQGDYMRIVVALKHLTEKDVKLMMDDALNVGKGQTVRSVFTDREIDIYRQENL